MVKHLVVHLEPAHVALDRRLEHQPAAAAAPVVQFDHQVSLFHYIYIYIYI
jgi:hypothetical protein